MRWHYKPEGRGFDSRFGHWILINLILPSHCGPGVDLASKRNEEYPLGNKGGRYLGLTTLQLACADGLENLGTSTFWSPKGLFGSVQELLCL